MEFHLDRGIRLHAETEYKNLYTWALREVPESGASVGHDQIPWVWTMNFTATECNILDSFSIEPDYTKRSENYPSKPTERQSIKMRLRPGAGLAGDTLFFVGRIIKFFARHIPRRSRKLQGM